MLRVMKNERATDGRFAGLTALLVAVALLAGFFRMTVGLLVDSGQSAERIGIALVLMGGLFVCQMCCCFPHLLPSRRRLPRRRLLCLQALLTYVPFAVYGEPWLVVSGLLAGSALVTLRWSVGWPAAAAAVVAGGVLMRAQSASVLHVLSQTSVAALAGLVVFGLSRLTAHVTDLHRSRVELARHAVEQDRLRVAQDLHDILGYSLSAITLKCALARRLLPTDGPKASRELGEIQQMARQAMADVRAVSSGVRRMTLAAEAHAVETLLNAVGVHTRVRIECGALSPAADTTLAAVLRESVTNLMRHSRAAQCVIEARECGGVLVLSVANDGADVSGTDDCEASGRGLTNLRDRLEKLGGGLTAGRRPDGWFRLTAEVAPQAQPDDAEAASRDGRSGVSFPHSRPVS